MREAILARDKRRKWKREEMRVRVGAMRRKINDKGEH